MRVCAFVHVSMNVSFLLSVYIAVIVYLFIKSFLPPNALSCVTLSRLFYFTICRYMNIPIIKEIQERVEKIQNDLKTHVRKSFQDIGQVLTIMCC